MGGRPFKQRGWGKAPQTMLPCLGAPSRPEDWDTPALETQPRGLQGLRPPSGPGRRKARGTLGAASFAPRVRGSRAPVRRGNGLQEATSSRASSPGLLGLREAGPRAPTPGDTHRPISRRSSGSSCSSRSRRDRGRRHPRPRSRPTPSAPPAGRPEMASSAFRPRRRQMASGPGPRSDTQEYPGREGTGPCPHSPLAPSAPSGGKMNSSLGETGSREEGWARPLTLTPP